MGDEWRHAGEIWTLDFQFIDTGERDPREKFVVCFMNWSDRMTSPPFTFMLRIPEEQPRRYVEIDQAMIDWVKEHTLGEMTWWHPMYPFFNGEEDQDGGAWFEIRKLEQFDEIPLDKSEKLS
jgi:hypothetical protein